MRTLTYNVPISTEIRGDENPYPTINDRLHDTSGGTFACCTFRSARPCRMYKIYKYYITSV